LSKRVVSGVRGIENVTRAIDLFKEHMSEEDAFHENAAILAALQERRRAERVKLARGATR
jgi:hypothetical protein